MTAEEISPEAAQVAFPGEAERLVEEARKLVMRRLELRDHSSTELITYLTSRGVPAQVAGHILERCQAVGLVDDARFARMWVECRGGSGQRSSRALRAELRTKGIALQTIQAALESYTPAAELDSARKFAERRYRSPGSRDRLHLLRNVASALGRRGYPTGTCMQVARETADRLLPCD